MAGMQFEVFVEDKKTVNAVIMSLEVIGEATDLTTFFNHLALKNKQLFLFLRQRLIVVPN